MLRFFLIILALLSASAGLAETRLTFCYDPYPPYTLGEGPVPEGGISVEMLSEVMARIPDLEADVVLLPWTRCQEKVRAGHIDGILPLFRTAEREEFMAFSGPVFQEGSGFWYRPDRFPDGLTWNGEDFGTLVHLRLAMLSGGHIDDTMQSAFEAVRPIERAQGVESLFNMLRYGRVDLVAFDLTVGAYHVREQRLERVLRPLNRPINLQSSHLGLSRASGADAYVGAIDRSLTSLHSDGTISALVGIKQAGLDDGF